MNNNIKVSIVLPVYNVEPFIGQCLDSLINQTLKEIEIILINDCSTDSSGKICDEYAAKDNRIVVVHNKKNIRQGLSRNKGIEIAQGEYIGFIDPDDWVDLDFYEKLYSTAKKNKSDIVKTEPIKIFSDGSKEIQPDLNKQIRKGRKKRMSTFLLFTYEHWSAIFKREIITKNSVNYPSIRNGEDIVFLLRTTYYSSSISVISGTYYYYRQHSNSTVNVRGKIYFESILQYFKLYLDFINSHEMDENHYNLVFTQGLGAVKVRYKEMDGLSELNDYRHEYLQKAFDIMLLYKYDPGYILDNFVLEFSLLERLSHHLKNLLK